MGNTELKSALIVSIIGNIIGLLSGIAIAFLNIVAPNWINRPDVKVEYVEALPIADFKSFDDALFIQFSETKKPLSTELQTGSDYCDWQLKVNKISDYCKDDIESALDQELGIQENVTKYYIDYSNNLLDLKVDEASFLPVFEGNAQAAQLVYLMNYGLGLAKAVRRGVPSNQGHNLSDMLNPLIENARGIFLAEVNRRRQYTAIIKAMKQSLQDMKLDPESGNRTGEGYFRVGIQNTGTGDALVSPLAKLMFAGEQIPLVPRYDRNRYSIVLAGKISEIMFVIDEASASERSLKSWEAIVAREEQEDFQIILSERGIDFGAKGRLPIVEFVSNEIRDPSPSGR